MVIRHGAQGAAGGGAACGGAARGGAAGGRGARSRPDHVRLDRAAGRVEVRQGGAELAFDIPQITREMVVVIQGLVILFMGALEQTFRPYLSAIFAKVD